MSNKPKPFAGLPPRQADPAEPELAAQERLAAARAPLLRRCLTAFALALIAMTWPLWTPQHVFPQLPALRWIGGLPDACWWAALAGLVGSLGLALVAPRSGPLGRRGLLAFALAAALLMAGDQHRWQPWAWQMLLTALALATLPPANSRRLLRWLTVSIYVYSAWSKCDVTFLDTLGQQFLRALAGPAGDMLASWPFAVRRALAGALVVAEFLVAAALLFPRTRRWGLGGAVASHLLLIWILGPWGLGHRPPVLIWNAYFIVQDVLLFGGPRSGWALRRWPVLGRLPPAIDAGPRAGTSSIGLGGRAVQGLFGLALLLPLLEPWGGCDPWLAWALYAPRVERVRILVSRSQERRLATGSGERVASDAASYLVPLADEPDWLELRADRWSLAAVGAPLYPSRRFQLGVALWLGERYALGSGLKVICFGPADRLSGAREHDVFTGIAELEAASDRYWLNARPR